MKKALFTFIVLLISHGMSWAQENGVQGDKRTACYGNPHPEGVPEFPGGERAKSQFIYGNIYYPPGALREKIQGTVIVGFTVEEDGTLTEFRLLKGAYYSLDAEALRIAEIMPNWIPGKYHGVPIKTQHTISVSFKLPVQY